MTGLTLVDNPDEQYALDKRLLDMVASLNRRIRDNTELNERTYPEIKDIVTIMNQGANPIRLIHDSKYVTCALIEASGSPYPFYESMLSKAREIKKTSLDENLCLDDIQNTHKMNPVDIAIMYCCLPNIKSLIDFRISRTITHELLNEAISHVRDEATFESLKFIIDLNGIQPNADNLLHLYKVQFDSENFYGRSILLVLIKKISEEELHQAMVAFNDRKHPLTDIYDDREVRRSCNFDNWMKDIAEQYIRKSLFRLMVVKLRQNYRILPQELYPLRPQINEEIIKLKPFNDYLHFLEEVPIDATVEEKKHSPETLMHSSEPDVTPLGNHPAAFFQEAPIPDRRQISRSSRCICVIS